MSHDYNFLSEHIEVPIPDGIFNECTSEASIFSSISPMPPSNTSSTKSLRKRTFPESKKQKEFPNRAKRGSHKIQTAPTLYGLAYHMNCTSPSFFILSPVYNPPIVPSPLITPNFLYNVPLPPRDQPPLLQHINLQQLSEHEIDQFVIIPSPEIQSSISIASTPELDISGNQDLSSILTEALPNKSVPETSESQVSQSIEQGALQMEQDYTILELDMPMTIFHLNHTPEPETYQSPQSSQLDTSLQLQEDYTFLNLDMPAIMENTQRSSVKSVEQKEDEYKFVDLDVPMFMDDTLSLSAESVEHLPEPGSFESQAMSLDSTASTSWQFQECYFFPNQDSPMVMPNAKNAESVEHMSEPETFESQAAQPTQSETSLQVQEDYSLLDLSIPNNSFFESVEHSRETIQLEPMPESTTENSSNIHENHTVDLNLPVVVQNPSSSNLSAKSVIYILEPETSLSQTPFPMPQKTKKSNKKNKCNEQYSMYQQRDIQYPTFGIRDSQDEKKVITTIASRLPIINKKTLKYALTVDELRRRTGHPEYLKKKRLIRFMRQAREKCEHFQLEKILSENNININTQTRRKKLTRFTGLCEEEATQLADDLDKLYAKYLPVETIAHQMLQNLLISGHNLINCQQMLIKTSAIMSCVIKSLEKRQPKITGKTEKLKGNLADSRHHLFSLVTHGFGHPNSLTHFKNYLKIVEKAIDLCQHAQNGTPLMPINELIPGINPFQYMSNEYFEGWQKKEQERENQPKERDIAEISTLSDDSDDSNDDTNE